MKKKIIGMLSVCAMALTLFAVNKMTTVVNAEENGQVVYVSTNGVDSNIGTISAPFQTLEKALDEVVDGGIIVLQDTVTIDTWEKHNKEVSITGGTLQMTWSNDIVINDSGPAQSGNASGSCRMGTAHRTRPRPGQVCPRLCAERPLCAA